MNIGLSGHRNCRTTWQALFELRNDYPGATWVWGNARDGFDSQVRAFVRLMNVAHIAIEAGVNPKLRNTDIVESDIEVLVVCHDGRQYGGTWDTIEKARARDIPIRNVPCIPTMHPYMPVRT